MPSPQVIDFYIEFAKRYVPDQDSDEEENPIPGVSSLGLGSGALSSAASYTNDPHAVSNEEARS